MNPTFNLLDEPWIKVLRLDGSTDELSLTQVFTQATELAAIHGELASQDIAIFRLLVAICHRTMQGPEDLETWEEYWNDPESLGRDAVSYLEGFRDRFDLRHPKTPFFQVAGIHSGPGKISGLEKLVADVPNGAQLFTTRRAEGLESMSWAESARWLVHVHAFDAAGTRTGAVGDPRVKGGRSYPIGTGWAGQIGVVTTSGSNLAESLLLNTVVTDIIPDLESVDTELDLAPWERQPDGPGGEDNLEPTGPVSCYTWQTRRVLLHGDERVTGLFLGNGNKAILENRYSVEPMTSWHYDEKKSKTKGYPVFMPRKLSATKAFWRGLDAVIYQLSPTANLGGKGGFSKFRAPAVLRFYESLMLHSIIPATSLIPIHAVGIEYRNQDSVLTQLIDTVLTIPNRLLSNEYAPLAALVQDAIAETESVSAAVQKLASDLDMSSGGNKDTSKAARARAADYFYQSIDSDFPQWLIDLNDSELETARTSWRKTLREKAYEQRENLVASLPATAFVGRKAEKIWLDAGLSLKWFQTALNKALPISEAEHEGVK